MKYWPDVLLVAGLGFAFFASTDSAYLVAQKGRPSLGVFEGNSDIGTVLHPGSATYDAGRQTYTVAGSGENMWVTRDAFQFAWKKVSGDVSLTAEVRFAQSGGNAHRKAALLIRQSLEADSAYADAALHGSGLTALQFRNAKGGVTGDVELNNNATADASILLRIEKRGDRIAMFVSTHGEPLHPSGATTRLDLDGPFYIGLGVCAHDKDAIETAVFSHVEVEPLAADVSAKPALYSTLQTISIDRDARVATIAYSSPGYFEAPNWTHDGKLLIFDRDGHIVTVPLGGGTPQSLDVGDATGCNGSHGLSPDGKWLAISCETPGAPGSRVYIVPSTGGAPRMTTKNPSSYFHSWSPDGRIIAFTRPHPGGGDIWSISVNGGTETRLTNSTGISDDPDYSPDGRYIYFNSDRSGGTMQIWRIRSGGTQPEQVTFDERNNWTPHISPDGKWMVFLSYDKSVGGHPTNKDISLRLMSLADTADRKVSDLVDILGGSGTINVPSWSPDSRYLAYVSYELVNP